MSDTDVPVFFRGKRDSSVQFSGVAVGLSETGLGFRSSDPQLGVSSLESLIRQPFICRFELSGVPLDEIIVRILRLEAARHDPAYLYFGSVEFLQITDVDALTLQTGLKVYATRSAGSKPYNPLISAPPPPAAKVKTPAG